MRKSFRRLTAGFAACTMALALATAVVPTSALAGVKCSDAGKKAGKADIDSDGTYHAYFGFQQSDSWVFRDAWFNPDTGLDGAKLEDPTQFNGLLQSVDGKTETVEGTVTDAEIAGNGTYTVGVSGIDASKLNTDVTTVSMLYMSTDIPSSAKDTIKISDVKFAIDGVDKGSVEPYVNADAEEWGLLEYDVINTYQQDGYENPTSMAIPQDSITITFTVSGFNYDNIAATGDTSSATSGSDAAGTDANSATTGSESSSSGMSTGVVVAIVVVAVVVVAGVVVVVKKKKN